MEKRVTTTTILKECGVSLEITATRDGTGYYVHANGYGSVRATAEGIHLDDKEVRALYSMLSETFAPRATAPRGPSS